MPRKIDPVKKEELKLKSNLENLLNDSLDDLKTTVINAREILPPRMTTFMDYDNVKEYANNNSENIVNSIALFYLNKQIIDKTEYVKQKSVVDKITVSNLLFQMKTAEHAIIKLLEEIDNGSMHPRSFEVLASLQKSKMEIVKHLATFMTTMENNYKSLREDYRTNQAEDPDPIDITDESTGFSYQPNTNNQIRGGKQLMEMIRGAIPEKKAGANPTSRNAEEITDIE